MSEKTTGEFSGKRVAVIGLAATGLATAKALRDRGAIVTVYESKMEELVDPARVAELQALGDISVVYGVVEPDWSATDLIVPSPGVPRYARSLIEAPRYGVTILSEIEVAYRLASAPILAITGTNGKTTTTALVGAICRAAGRETFVAGNIAEDAGVRLPLIEAAVQAPSSAVIIAEISSFQLEWVELFRPRAAAWLNLTDDHLDRHKDADEYARAKSFIFRAQTEEDYAVLNADDPIVLQYGKTSGLGTRWLFSLNGAPEGASHSAYLDEDGVLVISEEGKTYGLIHRRDIPIPGLHNVANVLAAAAMTLAFGIAPNDIVDAVKGFKGVAHRMETVREVGGVRYINNSMCTNPAAVAASVSAIETPLIAIVGGIHKGGDLSGMARALAEASRHIVLIGQSKAEIANALRAEGFTDFENATTLPEAVQKAAKTAQSGETVMLVPGCASFDMFTGFEQRGQVFRDAVAGLE